MRKILVTNDDGIDSDGIKRLAEAACRFGEVWVIAPESQRSAASHSITLREPIYLEPYDFPVEGVRAFACSGKPADCIRIGVLNVVPGKPDVILSGINYGYNCATDLQYSATAGAAFEGKFQGIHSIALSENMSSCHEVTDRYLSEILGELMDKPLDYGQIWNVNFPGCPLSECRGILRDRKVSRDSFFHDRYDEKTLPDGRLRYTVRGIYNEESEEGTDFKAIVDKYVSIGIVNNFS